MRGLMQNHSLLISNILRHAEKYHADQEVVSRRVEGDIHRQTFSELAARSRKLANALKTLGLHVGDFVGTLAWNGYRHLELYYAVSGIGAVLNTINPRLHADQIKWIVNNAGNRILFFDLTFLPVVESICTQLATVQQFVLMTDRANMPAITSIPNLLSYEELLDAEFDHFDWPKLQEDMASSLCYTSGTTGNPKGVLYSHRSTVLHSYAAALPDSMSCSAQDSILPVVPMFHVNAWGLPYTALMVGAKLVLPGPFLDGKSLHELLENEQVTLAAGVPTVWQGLLDYVASVEGRFTSWKRTVIGGAACPPKMMDLFEQTYGISVLHAWGMTELSPLGTVGQLKARHMAWSLENRLSVKARQGRPIFGIDIKIVDSTGAALPNDGLFNGELMVQGPWVISEYFKSEGDCPLVDGWFPTGDVANIDADGYMQITDRSKDVIKSGGEWISSIDLENIAVSHPGVTQAACIGASHDKWGERPVLVVVKKPGFDFTSDDLLKFFTGKIAKWWTPDTVVFVDSLPIGATGKVLKSRLREKFGRVLVECHGSIMER